MRCTVMILFCFSFANRKVSYVNIVTTKKLSTLFKLTLPYR